MKDVDYIIKMKEFLLSNYEEKLLEPTRKETKHLVIDFTQLMNFDPDIADFVLENPTDSLKCFELAVKDINEELNKGFVVRFKNCQKFSKIPINSIRTNHISKFITIEGIVRQKSEVRGQSVSVTFECPNCAKHITVIQLDENQYIEPKICSCARRGKFKEISKDRINLFSMSVEEPTDLMSGGTKLSRIKVLCKNGLTNPEIERLLYQGIRVQITGVLVELQLMGKTGKPSNKIDWYLDANYVKVFDESFFNIKWTGKEEEEFKQFAQRPDWLKCFRESIFYDIYGYHEEQEGIILQMFGGVTKQREAAKVKGTINVLLIGDPGSSKSTMLKIAQNFSPKAMYVSGKGASGVGLTGSVVKDELIGGYCVEAGAFVLCNNGILCLDELDKVDETDVQALHTVLSENIVVINKASIQATMKAETSCLAAANPKHGTYSEYDSVYSQINLTPTLINRFDLIYPIKESKLTENDDFEIAKKILNRSKVDEKKVCELSKEFIRKYIAYAKTINPVMPPEVIELFANEYMKLKKLKRRCDADGKQAIPVSGRNVAAMRMLAEAVARSRLHEIVTLEDAKIAYRKMVYSIQQVGIDPESGELMIESIGGKPMKQMDLASRIVTVLRELVKQTNESVDHEQLKEILRSEGFDNEMKLDAMLVVLKRTGDIMEPRSGRYKAM